MLDNYKLGKTLGKGYSAEVKVGTTSDGAQHALKIFNLADKRLALSLLHQELDIGVQLIHENIVRYQGFSESSTLCLADKTSRKVAYIAQELASGGELFDHVVKQGTLSEAQCKTFFKQMVSGVNHMHQVGFAHRDLKMENLLLDENMTVKVADLGFACALTDSKGPIWYSSFVGTKAYMAPEVLMQRDYLGAPVDIFSLGAILFCMRAGTMPFKEASRDDRWYQNFVKGCNHIEKFWEEHSKFKPEGFFSQEFKDLVSSMLAFDPQERPTAA